MALSELAVLLGVKLIPGDEKNVTNAIDRLKAAAGGLAAAWAALKAGEGLLHLVEGVGELGDETLRTAERLGITTDALQEQRFAAEQVDVSAETLTTAYRTLGKAATEAAAGGKGQAEAFAALGVKVTDAGGKIKTVDVLLAEAADGLSVMQDKTKRAALAQEIFGRSGGELIPMLSKGSAGLAEMAKMAHEVGYVLGDEALEASAKFDDASDALNATLKGLRNTFGAELLPLLAETIQMLADLAKASAPFVKMLAKGVLLTIKVLAAPLKLVLKLFEEMEKQFGYLGVAASVLMVALAALGVSFALAGQAATIAGLKAAAAWIIATAPVLLFAALLAAVGAAIFLIIDDFVAFSEGGESVIGDLITYFTSLVDELGGVGGAIKEIFFNSFNAIFGMGRETFDALADGIIWAFETAIGPVRAVLDVIQGLIFGLGEFVTKIFVGDIVGAFTGLWNTIKVSAEMFVDDLIGFFRNAVKPLQDVMNLVTGTPAGASAAGSGSITGAPSAKMYTPAGAMGGGKGDKKIEQQNHIEIKVDAAGATKETAGAIGRAAGESAGDAVERANRQTHQAFASTSGT